MDEQVDEARRLRLAAKVRLVKLREEFNREVAASLVYAPGETVYLTGAAGPLEATVLKRLDDGYYNYLVRIVPTDEVGPMEARYFNDPPTDLDLGAGAAEAGVV